MKFEDLLGVTLSRIDVTDEKDEITFTASDGRMFRQWHEQDCCENVTVEDIAGDLADLLNVPIALANETAGVCEDADDDGDVQWTFYNLATNKGAVTIRWLGTSNGYYSTSVSFEQVEA